MFSAAKTAGPSGYTVGRSLRFRSSATAYLNRTPASASNRKTWTWSAWFKRGTLTANNVMFNAYVDASNRFSIIFNTTDNISVNSITAGTTTNLVVTSAVYRDPSAWYHIIVAFDTTQATASNRLRLYVNGSEVTSFGTDNRSSITQNSDSYINNNIAHQIGWNAISSYLDGYLAEVNFIDGQQLTPSSFGAYDTNGVWQPKKYTGTYGTNGFYLPFSNTTSTTTLVADSSGNGNNWTPNNISLTAGTTYDSMIDSPTVGTSSSNYCTWNPIFPFGNQTLTNGNLSVATGTSGGTIATISVSSGKWYWEVSPTTISAGTPRVAGLVQAITAPTSLTSKSIYLQNDGKYSINGAAAVTYGGAITTSDIVGVALDVDAQTVTFYKNGSAMGSAISISSVYTAGNLVVPAIVQSGGANNAQDINFGQRPFAYTLPTGFNALNTYNLPTPSIKNGALYMAATLYTGTGAQQDVSTNFIPGFLWIKSRSAATNNRAYDSVRGIGNRLVTNDTSAEVTSSTVNTTSPTGNGFRLGATDTDVNNSGATYVAWQWLTDGVRSSSTTTTGSSNTAGSITSTVSANTSAGFSIVTYTGTGAAAATVGHGLGVAPQMIFTKMRSSNVANWNCWHTGIATNQVIYLNSTSAVATPGTGINWNPTSSTFRVDPDGGFGSNASGVTQVAYCFAAISGYSAFGSYTGNGSTDGPFVYTGFRPRYVLVKRTDSTSDWYIWDTSRDTYNVIANTLLADTSGAETSATSIDGLSNGFKCRSATVVNASGGTYVYAAFAENPFNYSRAR